VARILIVGGGMRGVRLAQGLGEERHAVRIVTRSEAHRAAIEAAGAECFLGTADRLLTLSAALEHVTIACWLLATATGSAEEVAALHASRLEQFVTSVVDTTVRGLVYEAGGSALPRAVLARGEAIIRERAARNAIPAAVLGSDPRDDASWMEEARQAIAALLEGRPADSRALS
jgi:hypothetical protein